MARTLSSNLQTQIANDQNKICFLVEINFSTPLRATDHYSNVTYDSTENGEAQIEEITITFSNITSTVKDLIEDGNYTNTSVNIYIAFFDNNETIVDATTYFSGIIGNCSITESDQSSHLSMVVQNHWANWQLKKGRHFTDESQQHVFSGDKGFEYADQTKEDIRWGAD
jgi:hypothetical protein